MSPGYAFAATDPRYALRASEEKSGDPRYALKASEEKSGGTWFAWPARLHPRLP
jgi:hypothetical protein